VPRRAPSYVGLRPASPRASAAARGSSRKTDTSLEIRLRRQLYAAGLRYRKNVTTLPGCPDIVFLRAKLAIFCDGDFWHGRDWPERKRKLLKGTNAQYWVSKIERNIMRDATTQDQLERAGWRVLRFWESEIGADSAAIVAEIRAALDDE
jgi:DNA mismatch endonuclease (patch repair protein)